MSCDQVPTPSHTAFSSAWDGRGVSLPARRALSAAVLAGVEVTKSSRASVSPMGSLALASGTGAGCRAAAGAALVRAAASSRALPNASPAPRSHARLATRRSSSEGRAR